jgi:hypothetical protein
MARLFRLHLMTKEERLNRLRSLRKPNILNAFSSREEFVDWQAEVAPLLNFHQLYHSNFVAAADIASHPNLSSRTINPSLARLDMLMKQAITELEHDLSVDEEIAPVQRDTAELDFAEICRRLRWKQLGDTCRWRSRSISSRVFCWSV